MDCWTGEIFKLSCTELGQGVHVEAAVLIDKAVDWELVDMSIVLWIRLIRHVERSITARSTPTPLLAVLGGDVRRTGVTPATPAQSHYLSLSLSS